MKKQTIKNRLNHIRAKGFTLIEMLAVAGIAAIPAVIASMHNLH